MVIHARNNQIRKDLYHYPPLHQTPSPPPPLLLGQYQTHHPQQHAIIPFFRSNLVLNMPHNV